MKKCFHQSHLFGIGSHGKSYRMVQVIAISGITHGMIGPQIHAFSPGKSNFQMREGCAYRTVQILRRMCRGKLHCVRFR